MEELSSVLVHQERNRVGKVIMSLSLPIMYLPIYQSPLSLLLSLRGQTSLYSPNPATLCHALIFWHRITSFLGIFFLPIIPCKLTLLSRLPRNHSASSFSGLPKLGHYFLCAFLNFVHSLVQYFVLTQFVHLYWEFQQT